MSSNFRPKNLKVVFGRTNKRSDQVSCPASKRKLQHESGNIVKPLIMKTAVPLWVTYEI
jgi:hypothetical protein